jgi:hypothetical protein
VFNINKAEDKTMRVYFPIDAIDRRTGTLLHDVRQWVTSHSRAGWQITEENADNDDDNAAILMRARDFIPSLRTLQSTRMKRSNQRNRSMLTSFGEDRNGRRQPSRRCGMKMRGTLRRCVIFKESSHATARE